jgi:hypothetical protein
MGAQKRKIYIERNALYTEGRFAQLRSQTLEAVIHSPLTHMHHLMSLRRLSSNGGGAEDG